METRIYRQKKNTNSRGNSIGGSFRQSSNANPQSWRITNVSPTSSPRPIRNTTSEVQIWHHGGQNNQAAVVPISRNSSRSSLYSSHNGEVGGEFRIMQSRSPTPEVRISFPNQGGGGGGGQQRNVLVEDINSAIDINNRIAYWEVASDDSGLSEQELIIPSYDFSEKALYPQVPVELILEMPQKVKVPSEPYYLQKFKKTNMPIELLQEERPDSPLGYKRFLFMKTPPLPNSRLNEVHEYDLVRVNNSVQIRKRGEAIMDNEGVYSHRIEENSNFLPEGRTERMTPSIKKKMVYQDRPAISDSVTEDSWVVYHSIPYAQRQNSYSAPKPLLFDVDYSQSKIYHSSEQKKTETIQPPKKVKDLTPIELKSIDTQVEIPEKESLPDHFHYQYQDAKKEKQVVELNQAAQEQERILRELKNEVKQKQQDLKKLEMEKEKQRNELYDEEEKKLRRLQEELKKYEEEREKQIKQLEEEKMAYLKIQKEEEESRLLKQLQEENKRLEEEKEKKRKRLEKEKKELIKRQKEEEVQIKLLDEEYRRMEEEKEMRKKRLKEEKKNLKLQREEEERRRLMEEENRRFLEEKERQRLKIELEKDEHRRYLEETEKQRHKLELEKEESRRFLEEKEKQRRKIEREKEEHRRFLEEKESQRRQIEQEKEEHRRFLEEKERQRRQIELEQEEKRKQEIKKLELERITLLQTYEREKEEKFKQHLALTEQNKKRLLELQRKNEVQEIKTKKSLHDGFPESLKLQLKKFNAMQQRSSQRQKKNFTLFPISDSVQQTIDIKEEEKEVSGMSLLLDAKPESYSESYNTIDERVSIKIDSNNATIDVIIMYEVYHPLNLDSDLWLRKRVIVTRLVFIDLNASQETRKAFDRMVQRTLPNLKWTGSESINLTGSDAYKLYNALMSVVEDETENSRTQSKQKSVTMDTLPHYLEAGYDQITSDDMIY